MLVDVPCVGVTDPINDIVMDQICNCVGLVYVVNCAQRDDFEVDKVRGSAKPSSPSRRWRGASVYPTATMRCHFLSCVATHQRRARVVKKRR